MSDLTSTKSQRCTFWNGVAVAHHILPPHIFSASQTGFSSGGVAAAQRYLDSVEISQQCVDTCICLFQLMHTQPEG